MSRARSLAAIAMLLAVGPVAARPQTPISAATVNFSFDNADIRLLIRLVGEVTGRRFIVDERVVGQITVLPPGPVRLDEVYPLFLSILEARGFSAVERDGAVFIVPLPERTAPAPALSTEGAAAAGLATRIFALQHVEAVEVARAIEPLVRGAKAGGLSAFGATNHLIVTDTDANLRRLAAVLQEIDRPGAGRAVEVVALKHAAAEEVAAQVMAAMGGAERSGARVSRHLRAAAEGAASAPGEVLVVPAAHSNSLVLVGPPIPLAEMKRIVALLDVESVPTGVGRLNAIFLKYLSAEEAAKSLNAVLAKTAEKDARQRIAIEPNAPNNALIVEASPRDFQWVRDLLESLDRPPQQVMIEILIAEVTLGSQLDLGVTWSTIEQPREGANTAVARSRPGPSDTLRDAVTKGVFPQGLAVGVARGVLSDGTPKIPFWLEALQQNRDVRILSNVPLWAQNNKEASVSVVDNIPLLRSTIEGGSGTARDVIQNIDRADVGIKLKVTPHVNPDRQITVQLNPSIEAVVDEGPTGTNFAPTIAKREIQTTVTVPDGSTVVLGGLIRQDRVRRIARVPVLGSIPVLGRLFRYTQDRTQRSNLLVFVTPKVVGDAAEADAVRRDLETRSNLPSAAGGAAERPE